MHDGMYGVILRHMMRTKVGVSFAGYVDTLFWSGFGGGFEVGVKDVVASDNGSIVNNDGTDEVDLDICNSSGWSVVGRDDRK